jgi:hypothetical protein
MFIFRDKMCHKNNESPRSIKFIISLWRCTKHEAREIHKLRLSNLLL